jgi:hypothetical protein
MPHISSGCTYHIYVLVKEVLLRTASTMCGIGSDQNVSYCERERERNLHHTLYKSNRFNYSIATDISSRSGQLMHHFIDLVPTYESIAGSEQLGPNIFWTLTTLRYIAITQDEDFAYEIFPFVDLSTRFLLTFYDDSIGLVSAPGTI